MIVTCPKCQKTLNVPNSAAGRQGQCPSCQNVFTLPALAAPVEAPAAGDAPPPPPPGLAPGGAGFGAIASGKVGGCSLLKLAALLGGFLMFLSFFLPWWGVSFKYSPYKDAGRDAQEVQKDRKKAKEEFKEFQELIKDDVQFYYDALGRKNFKELGEAQDKGDDRNESASASGSAFGWDFGRGVVTFIFGLVVMGVVIPLLFVRFLQRWGWTGLLPAAVLGLVVFILALTVWGGTPGKNMSGSFISWAQGVSIGPFLALAGGLFVAAAAGLDGTLGLIGLFRGFKK